MAWVDLRLGYFLDSLETLQCTILISDVIFTARYLRIVQKGTYQHEKVLSNWPFASRFIWFLGLLELFLVLLELLFLGLLDGVHHIICPPPNENKLIRLIRIRHIMFS